MIAYTNFEIVELIVDADCFEDIRQIYDYLITYKKWYSINDLHGFQCIMDDRHKELLN